MTGKSFKKGDYTALWESGLFETEDELHEFMTKSQGEREIIWQDMYDRAVAAEQNALEAVIAKADERIPVIKGKLEDWWDTLKESVQTLS